VELGDAFGRDVPKGLQGAIRGSACPRGRVEHGSSELAHRVALQVRFRLADLRVQLLGLLGDVGGVQRPIAQCAGDQSEDGGEVGDRNVADETGAAVVGLRTQRGAVGGETVGEVCEVSVGE